MFTQVFIYFAKTIPCTILQCKNYFRFCADFIGDYSILISGWIDEAVSSERLAMDGNLEAPLISTKTPTAD